MPKKIPVSDAVWDEIAKRGSFGETEDTVLRRVFDLPVVAPKQGQTRESGARAANWGRETADKLAIEMSAESINPRANEYELDGEKFTIRCAHANTSTVGVTYKMLDRIDSVIAALENDSGEFDLFKLTPAQYSQQMRATRSKGPSAGRVGMVRTSFFRKNGKSVGSINLTGQLDS
jgi:hypothetical protein